MTARVAVRRAARLLTAVMVLAAPIEAAAEAVSPELTVEQLVRPPDAVRKTAAFVAAGDGSAGAPWTGWESIFDELPPTGAQLVFEPGHYRQRRPIALPVDLEGWLEILGRGATIHLTRAAPRFLDVGRGVDGETLRRIHIDGFTLDAHHLGGRHHVILGTLQDGDNSSGRCLDVDGLVVRNVTTRNVLTFPNPKKHHRLNLWLGSFDPGVGTLPCPQGEATIRNVLVEGLDLDGGNMGVVIFGSGADPARVRLDEIHVHRVRHDLGVEPRRGYYSSNVHIGSRGHGGRVHVSGVEGRNSADVGIEVNGFLETRLENNTLENAYFAAVLLRNYTDKVDVSRQRFDVRETTVNYTMTGGNERTKRGMSISESGPYPIGTVRVESYAYYSVANKWTGQGSCLHVNLRNAADRNIEVRRFHCSMHALDDGGGLELAPILLRSEVSTPIALTDGTIDIRGVYRGQPAGREGGHVRAIDNGGQADVEVDDVRCDFHTELPPGVTPVCFDPQLEKRN